MQKTVLILILLISFCSCKREETIAIKKTPVRKQPKNISFHFENTKQWLAKDIDSSQIRIVLAVNRTDKGNITKMDSIIVPEDMTGDIEFYLPFPLEVPYLESIDKIIFFSYPTQTFATYENGILIHTGPTNMGRKKDPTPTLPSGHISKEHPALHNRGKFLKTNPKGCDAWFSFRNITFPST
jgi:hypothetical protein